MAVCTKAWRETSACGGRDGTCGCGVFDCGSGDGGTCGAVPAFRKGICLPGRVSFSLVHASGRWGKCSVELETSRGASEILRTGRCGEVQPLVSDGLSGPRVGDEWDAAGIRIWEGVRGQDQPDVSSVADPILSKISVHCCGNECGAVFGAGPVVRVSFLSVAASGLCRD